MKATLYFALGILFVLLGGFLIGYGTAFHKWINSDIDVISSFINEYGQIISPSTYQDLVDYYNFLMEGMNLSWSLVIIGTVFCGLGICAIYLGVKVKVQTSRSV